MGQNSVQFDYPPFCRFVLIAVELDFAYSMPDWETVRNRRAGSLVYTDDDVSMPRFLRNDVRSGTPA